MQHQLFGKGGKTIPSSREATSAAPPVGAEITTLLQAWAAGKPGAREALFERVYPDLRRISGKRLSTAPLEPLDATELVHEVFLRLVQQRQVDWKSRDQFFALSARLLRRILVDEARSRLRAKRSGGAVHIALDQVSFSVAAEPSGGVDVLALDEALTELAAVRAVAARVVELRFFSGLSIDEAAASLGLGRATVIRTWRFARAWLARKLEDRP